MKPDGGAVRPGKALRVEGKALRVGLLSPYNGTNLGDQAIYTACLQNLRDSRTGVEIVGICLNPAQVAALHGIPTFPITGLPIRFYSTAAGLFGSTAPSVPTSGATAAGSAVPAAGTRVSFRELLKRIPGTRAAARGLRAVGERVLRIPRELLWIGRSWKLLGTLDGVIVAGGGQIDEEWGGPWGHPYALFRWAVLSRLRNRKFVIASVGVCKARSPVSRSFFRNAIRLAQEVSCRDEGSVALVAELVGRPAARFVPDLACGLNFPQLASRPSASRPSGLRIAVSPIAFGRRGNWPTEAEQTYRRYLGVLKELVTWLLESGHPVRILTTSSPDYSAVEDLLDGLPAPVVTAAGSGTGAALEVVRPATVEQLCRAFDDCSIVVASRLHGVMLAHLAGKPVLAISFDRKVDVHLEQFSQGDFRTDIHTVTTPELRAGFERLVASEEDVRRVVRQQRDRHRAAVLEQFEAILNSLSAGERLRGTPRGA